MAINDMGRWATGEKDALQYFGGNGTKLGKKSGQNSKQNGTGSGSSDAKSKMTSEEREALETELLGEMD